MALAKAQMLVPTLAIHDAAPAEDEEGLHRLALWILQRFSPLVAADPPDGIVIDCTGADHLHGGEGGMVQSLVGRLAMSGVEARAAVADSWAAAHAFARHLARPTFVADPGRTLSLLSPLPLEALRLPMTMTADLRTLGFRTIGDLHHQPRAPLVLRFGPHLAHRLDQAMGEAAETIARYIGKLVTALCALLEARGLGACRLDLRVHRVDNRLQAVRVGMALPTRDARRLTRLLCDKIETIDPGFGIEAMVLVAAAAEPLAMKQTANALVAVARPDIFGLVDTLANRIGGGAIYRMAAVASDVPERSVQRIPAMAPDTGMGWPDHWPRSTRLLARPEPIETVALLPDHPPASFTWQGVRRRVRRADGPERVFGEWWKRDADLALQMRISFDVSASCDCLMSASPY